nr:HNH endonuclease [Pseudomonas alcaliphila]
MQHYPKTMPGPTAELLIEKEKPNGTYRLESVLTQLQIDFHNKCYICEDIPQSINIEHLIPHKEDKNLKFSWINLCWSCGHCNNIKLSKYDTILNCLNDPNIESKLEYIYSPFPSEQVAIQDHHNTDESKLTKEMLLGVFNGTTPMKKIESNDLRKKICKELLELNQYVLEFTETQDTEHRELLGVKIKARVKESAKFASFTRAFLRKHTLTLQELRAKIENFPI